jgi:hypothetical protein
MPVGGVFGEGLEEGYELSVEHIPGLVAFSLCFTKDLPYRV